ncbi:MAG: bifunctional UDP-3-O-[3-hydroxymyristoyl] N-acetylglucosamine deacetylase/3-hydroxyacyl-ACP dehydratase [Bacteroidales bacterium]
MQDKQQTLKRVYDFEGVGLHSGRSVKIRLIPAGENEGIKIIRCDLVGKPEIAAVAENVTLTERGTVLEKNGVKVSTVEHLMSALFGLGIDNAVIEADGPEFPILDGSAAPYARAISSDGTEVQNSPRRYFEIMRTIRYRDEVSGSEITIEPAFDFEAEIKVDFNSKVLGVQSAHYKRDTNFTTEIAPSRTFVFLHDIEMLIKHDLIKGGDLGNAVVISEKRVEGDELKKLGELFGKNYRDSIESGYMNIDEPLFPNECARHKLLDLLGDLYLSGVRFKGKVTAYKPGHKINTEIAKIIRKMALENQTAKQIPQFDPNAQPVIDINGIKRLLPHRPPFLMVDRIISMNHEEVVGIKTVGINEGYFIGHFPDEPVMPGVLIIEAMAQVGGILVLSDLEEPEKHSTYFAKIDNAKFKRKVVPGDVLVIKLTLTAPLRRSIVCMKGEVYVGNTLACEADLVAQVIKNK